jgi:hypothetical protein
MIDLHLGVVEIFAEAQERWAPHNITAVFGRFEAGASIPKRKTGKTMHCTNCGQRGHLTRKCVNFDQ